MIDLTKESEQILTGNDNIVIRKYIDGIEGGRALDITEYVTATGTSVVKAGHVIITKEGEYKPMPVSGDAYSTLPEGWKYAGILVATINAKKDGAAILTNGTVNKNDKVMPYSITSILTALKVALPLISFMEDGE